MSSITNDMPCQPNCRYGAKSRVLDEKFVACVAFPGHRDLGPAVIIVERKDHAVAQAGNEETKYLRGRAVEIAVDIGERNFHGRSRCAISAFVRVCS